MPQNTSVYRTPEEQFELRILSAMRKRLDSDDRAAGDLVLHTQAFGPISFIGPEMDVSCIYNGPDVLSLFMERSTAPSRSLLGAVDDIYGGRSDGLHRDWGVCVSRSRRSRILLVPDYVADRILNRGRLSRYMYVSSEHYCDGFDALPSMYGLVWADFETWIVDTWRS